MAKAVGSKSTRKPAKKTILGLSPQQAAGELAALYGRSKKLRVNIRDSHYANLAFVQVSPRDVFIDFIQAPGLPAGDEILVEVTRIYLSAPAAKSLASVLGGLVENLRKSGQFEKLE